jgi:hypothetical protein
MQEQLLQAKAACKKQQQELEQIRATFSSRQATLGTLQSQVSGKEGKKHPVF